MLLAKYNWLWIILAPLLLIGLAACDDNDGNLNEGHEGDDGVVAGTTPDITATPEADRNNDIPRPNEVPELVRDGLERAFGNVEWFNDIGDIERDGDTVRFKLDRSFTEDAEAFEDSCNAVAGLVMGTRVLDVETVEVADEDGDVVMAAEGGESECAPIGR